MVVIPRLPILMLDSRWRLHAAAEEGIAEPKGKGPWEVPRVEPEWHWSPDGTLPGKPLPSALARCPHPPDSSSGLPLMSHSWEGGTWRTDKASRGEGDNGKLCKGGSQRLSLEQACYPQGHTAQKDQAPCMALPPEILASNRARSGPWCLHEGRQTLAGRWGAV
uniref:Uncharacterized protein n=1 Tax=Pipistrellus kuhlii TaxID=59472 RepID=A0A7J7V101_PIPKU|nr:hypothetical protein mPipKuh1_008642 [Pipistrellus kuhlii]